MKTDELIHKVKECSRKLEELKLKRANLVGQRDRLLEDLKDKFDVTSIEDAEKLAEELEKELDESKQTLEESREIMDAIIEKAGTE